jgi:hypothetical protein
MLDGLLLVVVVDFEELVMAVLKTFSNLGRAWRRIKAEEADDDEVLPSRGAKD